jgi:hypothetical protein
MRREAFSSCLHTGLACCFAVLVLGCSRDGSMPSDTGAVVSDIAALSVSKGNPNGGAKVLYSEKFSKSARGWVKIAGPGTMEVTKGVFFHPTVAYSAWCEYAYSKETFADAIYEFDVYVKSSVLCTQFTWRNPTLAQLTATCGAFQVRFNNSTIAPGTPGNLIFEKRDPVAGWVVLLDIPEHFYGLNHVVITDLGSSITISVNGVNYGTVDVSGYSPAGSGYLGVTGGDRDGGDYFDNIVVRQVKG